MVLPRRLQKSVRVVVLYYQKSLRQSVAGAETDGYGGREPVKSGANRPNGATREPRPSHSNQVTPPQLLPTTPSSLRSYCCCLQEAFSDVSDVKDVCIYSQVVSCHMCIPIQLFLLQATQAHYYTHLIQSQRHSLHYPHSTSHRQPPFISPS